MCTLGLCFVLWFLVWFWFGFAPKGLRLEAQGCRFGYPGIPIRLPWVDRSAIPNREAVAPIVLPGMTQPLCGWRLIRYQFTQGSRSGNPGL
jgi:hypothetical protein